MSQGVIEIVDRKRLAEVAELGDTTPFVEKQPRLFRPDWHGHSRVFAAVVTEPDRLRLAGLAVVRWDEMGPIGTAVGQAITESPDEALEVQHVLTDEVARFGDDVAQVDVVWEKNPDGNAVSQLTPYQRDLLTPYGGSSDAL